MATCNGSNMDAALKITELLLENGAVVNIRNKRGYTPFMHACESGNVQIVRLLLHCAEVDAVDNFGCSVITLMSVILVTNYLKLIFQALHYAVEKRHIEIVEILLKAGAEKEIVNSKGFTPGGLATDLGYTELEEMFPKEIVEHFPLEAEQYGTYKDLAPQIFPDYDQLVINI